MARFGVPPHIDSRAVEAFLRRAATPSLIEALAPESVSLLTVQNYRLVAEFALRDFLATQEVAETVTGSPGLLKRRSNSRALISSIALVLLCVLAVFQSARVSQPQVERA